MRTTITRTCARTTVTRTCAHTLHTISPSLYLYTGLLGLVGTLCEDSAVVMAGGVAFSLSSVGGDIDETGAARGVEGVGFAGGGINSVSDAGES